MSTFRIRVVMLNASHGAGTEFPYAVQVSGDSLSWWTLNRFKTEDEALGAGKGLEAFLKANLLVKEARIIWSKAL